jgi:hypothetical protein
MKEMADIILKYALDYDYYLMFRTDTDILFDLPPIDIFNEAPSSVYGFYTDYWKFVGNLGGHYIHKNYINSYLMAPYKYINNISNFNILNQKHSLWDLNTKYYKELNPDDCPGIPNNFPHQETLFILAFEYFDITINKIHNLPFYYNVDIQEKYTFNNGYECIIKPNNICYKYELQYAECNKNLIYWTNGYRWKIVNNQILLLN